MKEVFISMWSIGLFVLLFAVCVTVNSLMNDLQTKIMGGNVVEVSNYSFVVSVQRNQEHLCTGSIYTNKVILTAAACVKDVNIYTLTVLAKTRTIGFHGVRHTVKKIIIQPPKKLAILILKQKIELSHVAQPINLTEVNDPYGGGTDSIALSWGWTYFTDQWAQLVVMSFETRTINLKKCKGDYNSNICIKTPKFTGPCKIFDIGTFLFNHLI